MKIMSSIVVAAMKPNKKYTGGDRLCPDIILLALVGCTGQPIVAVDDEMVDGFVGQSYVPESEDNDCK